MPPVTCRRRRSGPSPCLGHNFYNAQFAGTWTVEGVASFPGLAVDRYLIDATLIARSLGTVGPERAKFFVAR